MQEQTRSSMVEKTLVNQTTDREGLPMASTLTAVASTDHVLQRVRISSEVKNTEVPPVC